MSTAEASLNILVRATDEASGVLDSISEGMQSVADMLTETVSDLSVNMQELLSQMMSFRDQASAAELEMTDLSANMSGQTMEAVDALNTATTSAGAAGTAMGEFGETVDAAASPLGTLVTDLALAEAGAANMAEGASAADEAVQGIDEGTAAAAESVAVMGTSMDTAATQADEAMTGIAAGVDGAVASMDELATQADAAATSMADGITSGAGEASTALESLATSTDAVVASLDTDVENLIATWEAFGIDMTAGVEEANASLDSLGVTADTAAEEVAAAGSAADVSLDEIAESAAAASESVTGVGEGFSKLLMSAMLVGGGVMGLDELTDHSMETAESIEQLSDATGMTADQSNQLLAMFAGVGLDAQTASQMVQMLDKNLTSMSSTTIKQMSEFGVQVKDTSTGAVLPFTDILNNCADAYQKLGPQQGTEMLETIFGKAAIQIAPLIANMQELQGITANIKSPFGDDAGLKSYIADTIQLHENMFEVSEDVTKIGVDITPAMAAIAKGIGDVLSDLTGGGGVIQAFEDWSKDVGALGDAVTVAIGLFGALKAAAMIGAAITAITEGITAVTEATTIWAAAQAALNIVLNANVIGLVVVAILALSAAAYEVITHWSTISGFFENLWTDIKTAADTAWTAIKTDAGDVLSWLEGNWPTILAILTGPIGLAVLAIADNWNSIKSTAITVVGDIESDLSAAWNAIVGTATTAWDDLESAVSGVWNAIVSDVDTAYNDIMGIINKIVSGIDSAISAMKSLLGMGGGGGSSSVSINPATRLAEGGIVDSPTIALIGEAGPEAVVPLGSSFGADMLGSTLGSSGSGSGQTVINIQCSGNITSSEESLANTIMQKIMEKTNLIGGNLDATWATGR